MLRGDNVIAVNLEKFVHGERFRECHAVYRYLLMTYIYQVLLGEMSKPLPLYLYDARIGNHQASSGRRINIPRRDNVAVVFLENYSSDG